MPALACASQSRRVRRARFEQIRGRLGESPASAGGIGAVEPPHLDAKPGLRCRHRQVVGMAVVAAVDRSAHTPALGAAIAGCIQSHRDDEVIVVSFDDTRGATVGNGKGISMPPTMGRADQPMPARVTSTPKMLMHRAIELSRIFDNEPRSPVSWAWPKFKNGTKVHFQRPLVINPPLSI